MNQEEIGRFLEVYTYEALLEEALNRVPSDIDTREGSVIYDALAPACYQLSNFYMQLKGIMQDSFALTAVDGYLDLRVGEAGLSRMQATRATRTGIFTDEAGNAFDVDIGSRFSSIGTDGVIFSVIRRLSQGSYELESEIEGSAGNAYIGQLLPIDTIPGLGTAEMGEIITPARNIETDEELRERYFSRLRKTSFGGNWNDYVETVLGLSGVGAVQVYPIWNGGGTVKVSILDADYNRASQSFLDVVKNELDPTTLTGSGYGLSPIGHHVTVVAPDEKRVNVSMKIDVLIGYSIDSVRPLILEAVNAYFLSLRKRWDDSDDLHRYGQTVYRSQIIAAILQIEGLANVSNVKLNGQEVDITLIMSGNKQEVAFLGEVVLT